jgi:uncharacterized protein
MLSISQIKEAVNKVAAEFPIKTVAIFGSYAEGTANNSSDVDVLVEFKAPAVSLLMLAGLKNRLENELHTSVDVLHGPLPSESMIVPKKVLSVYEQ